MTYKEKVIDLLKRMMTDTKKKRDYLERYEFSEDVKRLNGGLNFANNFLVALTSIKEDPVPEKMGKEPEDERIKKAIRLILIATEDEQKDFYSTHGLTRKDCTNWLEKQKEPLTPTEWTELTWKDIVELEGIINNVHYDFSAGIGQESFGKEVLERFRNKKDDAEVDACVQNSAWSEEDESCWNLIWDILDGPFVTSKESFKKAAAWFLKNCPKGTKSLHSNKQD